MPLFRASELVSIVYFAGMALLAWRSGVPPRARLQSGVTLAAVAATLFSLAAAERHGHWATEVAVARDWLPGLLLLLAYWAPARLVVGRHHALERWLLALDRRALASSLGRRLALPSRPWRELFELSYVAVYPMVPAAFLILLAAGLPTEVDRFWTIVLASEYVCYVLLPILPTRPPREVERAPAYAGAASTVRRLNVWILGWGSNHWNTFPSGHVAGAFACALALLPVLPLAGALLLVLSVLIACASVAGRYHYVADAVAGAAVAVAVFAGVLRFGV